MAHFAKVVAGKVTEVIVAEQDFVDTLPGQWIQTSYNTHGNKHLQDGTPLRGNYAGIGYTYDAVNDVFYAPKPYASWTLNTSWIWECPVPMPTDGKIYGWDEEAFAWVETPVSEE
jgi:hypothetical protein